MHPKNGFHVLYSPVSNTPIICERVDWRTCPQHKHLSAKKLATTKKSEPLNDDSPNSDSVSFKSYETGFSVEGVLQEATDRKGGLLSNAEAQAAVVIGQWYENGDLKPSRSIGGHESDMLINFNSTFKPIQKGKKTIGIVELGSEGFQYFYEVENDKVAFRSADGFDKVKNKLPSNYSLRRKLDGKRINDNNLKWSAEAYIGGHGL